MKRFWVAVGLVAIVAGASDFIIHGMILKDLYLETAALWRPVEEMKNLAWLAILTYFLFAWVFVVIFTKGYEKDKSGIGQGLRYGFWMGLLLSVVGSLGCYVVLPMPVILAVAWILGGMIGCLFAGLAAGLVYKH